MTTEKLIINGVDHSVFNLEWAKRGGVCAIADHSEFGLYKYIKPIDKALHYFCDLEYLDDFGATMAPNDMRMATPAECEAAGVEYIKRPVSDQSLSDLQQRAQAALRYAEKLRGIFHVSMLKAYPQKTHQEISDEIDNAMKEVK